MPIPFRFCHGRLCNELKCSCLDGFRLAGEIFRNTIGSGLGSPCEPIKHLRRGLEIQIIAPKVSAYHAASASAAIGCTELIKLNTYSYDHERASNVQCVHLCEMSQKVLITLSGDTKYPGMLWYREVSLILRFTFVQPRWLTGLGTGFTMNSVRFA